MKKTALLIVLVLVTSVILAGCGSFDFDETGGYIVTPKEALELVENGAILVDAQSSEDYGLVHIDGAVNVPMSELVVNEPYKNMLAPASQIAQCLGAAGISENDTVLVYDNASNMMAARVQWTLNIYGNKNVKVVSGGLEALKKAGASTSMVETTLPETTYNTGDMQKNLIVSLDYLKSLINVPDENTVIIDTRSFDEYWAGTIPGSVHIEYIWRNYPNGEYKSVRDIQNTYINKGIRPEMKIILFCKTSVRAAETYTALKDAGYKDVRIYDGAWLEYEAVEKPEPPSQTAPPSPQDAS
ncbi:MAG: rhodanese-like domain-containing protein [Clostridia bacterium]|nr:rhodanese-like domain-containing protein [Clostridia bacterium]